MRAVIQRVSGAKVKVGTNVVSSIDSGLLIFIGIENEDSEEDSEWLVRKISDMRIFGDSDNKMNLSAREIGAQILIVSQFTLHAMTKKGNRPSFIRAAPPDKAKKLFDRFKEQFMRTGLEVKVGVFGADMKVSLTNDGPVTILIDSKQKE